MGFTENCSSSPATMVNHVQILKQQSKDNNFIERKKNISKESMAFHWLTPWQEVFLLPGEVY